MVGEGVGLIAINMKGQDIALHNIAIQDIA